MSLDLTRVAILTALFGAAAAAIVGALSLKSSLDGGATTQEHRAPALDFSDPLVRVVVLNYRDSFTESNLPSLATTCDRASESYRAFVRGGFGDSVLTSLDVRGNRYEAIEFAPTWLDAKPGSAKRMEWVVIRRATGASGDLETLRSRFKRILESGERAVIQQEGMDAQVLTLEACRHGRYHFFERDPIVVGDGEFNSEVHRV